MPTLPGTHLVFSDQFSTTFFDLGDWMMQSHVIPLHFVMIDDEIELTAKSRIIFQL